MNATQNSLTRVKCQDSLFNDFVYFLVLKDIDNLEITIDIVLSSLKNKDNPFQVIIYHHKNKKRELTDELSKLLNSKEIAFEPITYDGCNRALLFTSDDIKKVIQKIKEVAAVLVD